MHVCVLVNDVKDVEESMTNYNKRTNICPINHTRFNIQSYYWFDVFMNLREPPEERCTRLNLFRIPSFKRIGIERQKIIKKQEKRKTKSRSTLTIWSQ